MSIKAEGFTEMFSAVSICRLIEIPTSLRDTKTDNSAKPKRMLLILPKVGIVLIKITAKPSEHSSDKYGALPINRRFFCGRQTEIIGGDIYHILNRALSGGAVFRRN